MDELGQAKGPAPHGGPKNLTRHAQRLLYCGIGAIAGYGVHAGFHLLHGRPEDLLWTCHLGGVLVGVGLIAASRRIRWGSVVNGIGTLWLCLGTPLWLLDLAGGATFYPTSVGTHLIGLAMGLVGAWQLGMPRGTWWKAALAMVALMGLCRLLTPAKANVNLVFAIQRGWEDRFSSHASYLECMVALAAGYFFMVERVVRFFHARRHARSD